MTQTTHPEHDEELESLETEREVFVWPDIFRAIGPGDDMVVSAEKLREWLDEREHRKTLEDEVTK